MKHAFLPVSCFLLLVLAGMRGEPVRFSIPDDKGLMEGKQNLIQQPESLAPFLEKLSGLATTKSSVVSILHIGDSHIQGDYFTGRMRNHLQRDFGNAGRGLVLPGRVAGTNEPADIFSAATGKWENKRVIYPDQPLRTGISGITISTADSTAKLVMILKDPTPPQQFATFFFRKDEKSFMAGLLDSLARPVAFIGPFTREFPDASTVMFPEPTRVFSLSIIKTLPAQERFMLYGMSLTNGNLGVIYHGAGVNGAKYKHFTNADDFAPQTTFLKPDLIIISMGSNEALDYPYKDPAFEQQMGRFVSQMNNHNPGVPVLLTTPPGSFLNNKKKSPGLRMIADRIAKFAGDNKLACYNLYEAGGGDQFATRWSRKGMLQSDGIHFTRPGYELQGDMFYLALINAYNTHVSR